MSSATSDAVSRRSGPSAVHAWAWRLFLLVSLCYAWYCYYVPENQIVWAADFEEAERLADESNKPILVFFTGEWCVPCRIMKRNVFADNNVANLINKGFVPVMVDVDDTQEKELLERYDIGGTPITVVTDSKGNAFGWRVGGIAKADFLEFLTDPNPPKADDV